MADPTTASTPAPDQAANSAAGSAVGVVIARARAEVYAYVRDVTHLPRFVARVRRVSEVDAISSIWTVVEENGHDVDWEFIVTDDERDRLIVWSSSGRTPVALSARMEFEDASDAGTQVTLIARREAPPASGVLEQLLGAAGPAAPLPPTRADLLQLKALLESGEPVRMPTMTPAAERAVEHGIGIIEPEPPPPDPTTGPVQSLRTSVRGTFTRDGRRPR
jgi:uncharacterized membrane protein